MLWPDIMVKPNRTPLNSISEIRSAVSLRSDRRYLWDEVNGEHLVYFWIAQSFIFFTSLWLYNSLISPCVCVCVCVTYYYYHHSNSLPQQMDLPTVVAVRWLWLLGWTLFTACSLSLPLSLSLCVSVCHFFFFSFSFTCFFLSTLLC